jgi:hypothetical protein
MFDQLTRFFHQRRDMDERQSASDERHDGGGNRHARDSLPQQIRHLRCGNILSWAPFPVRTFRDQMLQRAANAPEIFTKPMPGNPVN